MVLKIAGAPESLEGELASIFVHREPLDLARSLARDRGLSLPELSTAIGHDAPVGRRFGPEEVPSAVRALEATLSALDPDDASVEPALQELARALDLFRTAQSYSRAVTLEV